VLTLSLRRKLKKPVGRLYTPDRLEGSEFLSSLRSSPLVVSVGDHVTETLHALGRTPDVQVVDGFERRVRRDAPRVPFVKEFRARNPAGTITLSAVRAISRSMKGAKPARVSIDGEEDLLAIPAIGISPLGSSVYYGQPGLGVVHVIVDERAKASSKQMMASMAK
jgi:GTP-dependent dephospho-CoA kinase